MGLNGSPIIITVNSIPMDVIFTGSTYYQKSPDILGIMGCIMMETTTPLASGFSISLGHWKPSN